jgi:glutathione S-transferase
MQGQANHFFRYAPENIQSGIDRYQNECKRLYSILEEQLIGQEYLVSNKYSVADVSTFTWVRWSGWAGIPMDKYSKLQKWMDTIEARPAVQKGLLVPDGPDQIEKLREDPNVKDPFQAWVMKGQNELKEAHGQ